MASSGKTVHESLESMKSIFNRTFSVGLFICLMHLLLGQGRMSDLVLCFGVDGHVAVEAASARCCYPSSLSTPPEIAALYSFLKDISNEDNCDPCRDIFISVGSPGQYLVPTQAASLQMTMCEFAPVEIAPEDSLSRQSPATNSALASLRTVILLI